MPGKIIIPPIRDLLLKVGKELQPHHIVCEEDRDLGRFEAEVLLSHALGKDRTWIHAHDGYVLPPATYHLFQSYIRRRKKHEPIAYIVGTKDFYGHTFAVNRYTLIPRPESEQLVELALQTLRSSSARPLAWDVGTGSGALAISLAKATDGNVLASDISAAALRVAAANAKRLKTEVRFVRANLLTLSIERLLKRKNACLVIIANLPYLPTSDKQRLAPDVTKYEPTNALFSGKDGLLLIKKLLKQIAKAQLPFNTLLLEYDPPQTETLRAFAASLFPKATIRIHQDLAGRDRVMEIVPSAT